MPASYRLYTINPDGKFLERIDLACGSDEEAIGAARKYLNACKLEVWSGQRLIRHITLDETPAHPLPGAQSR